MTEIWHPFVSWTGRAWRYRRSRRISREKYERDFSTQEAAIMYCLYDIARHEHILMPDGTLIPFFGIPMPKPR